jgi:hypothetical protein
MCREDTIQFSFLDLVQFSGICHFRQHNIFGVLGTEGTDPTKRFSLSGTQQMEHQSGFWHSVCDRVTLGKFIGGQQRSMQAALPPSTAPYSLSRGLWSINSRQVECKLVFRPSSVL